MVMARMWISALVRNWDGVHFHPKCSVIESEILSDRIIGGIMGIAVKQEKEG